MTIILSYDEKASSFLEGNKSEASAHLEINEQGIAKLTFSADAGLIIRRTASRQAESVCKSGFLLTTGKRVGTGAKLEVVDGDKLNEAHLREGHKFNR
ncbi:MAG: hypothetical protein INQ03_18040 [Candidatus Heimdallarchaeota archaeon]|nr:hypothetical protein [Candidatus Heimdallarchaeota archaeon]